MTSEQITHLAAECMLYEKLDAEQYQQALETFARLVREDMREQRDELVAALEYHQEQTRPIQRTIGVLAKVKEQP